MEIFIGCSIGVPTEINQNRIEKHYAVVSRSGYAERGVVYGMAKYRMTVGRQFAEQLATEK